MFETRIEAEILRPGQYHEARFSTMPVVTHNIVIIVALLSLYYRCNVCLNKHANFPKLSPPFPSSNPLLNFRIRTCSTFGHLTLNVVPISIWPVFTSSSNINMACTYFTFVNTFSLRNNLVYRRSNRNWENYRNIKVT